MARIEGVNYEDIPVQAQEMRNQGKQLNTEMTKAYATMGEMHNDWYGDRYNDLVRLFNNLIPSLNQMLELVVTNVPYTLETIANNYAQADRRENVTVASNEAPNKLTDLPIINDVGMKFLTTNVHEKQSNISTNFKNAKEIMDRIEGVYTKIQWQSEAAEAFKSTFTKLKGEIVTSFETLNEQFTKLMQQTQQDIENAENANNVNM